MSDRTFVRWWKVSGEQTIWHLVSRTVASMTLCGRTIGNAPEKSEDMPAIYKTCIVCKNSIYAS